MSSFKKIPIEGYTHVYQHNWTTPWGAKMKSLVHGSIGETLEELNETTDGPYEFDYTNYKHLGIAKIKIEMMED